MDKLFTVMVDAEYSAEEFWNGEGGKLWAKLAGVQDYVAAPDKLQLAQGDIDRLKACPGFSGGPEYASNALLIL